ncbi:MAG TPA: hypothetical protein VFD58_33815 [Blastocatellia bacterium]|nr:hypothetical protein [Blastocatellia bacterium]
MDLNQPLVDLVNKVDGAFGAILADKEGEEITSHTLPAKAAWTDSSPEERMKLIGAYQVINLSACRQMMRQLQMGNVRQLTLRYDAATILIKALKENFALILAIEEGGNIGKGLFYLDRAAEIINQDL